MFAVSFDFQGASVFVLHLAAALEDQGKNWVGEGVVISVRGSVRVWVRVWVRVLNNGVRGSVRV